MNARLYDPKLHRFLAPDNFIQDPSNSQNYNRYGYVWNNPLRYNDPSGDVVWAAVIVGAVVGAYMGGTLANDGNYNPIKWDYNSGRTWGYMMGGAITGAVSGYAGGAIAASGGAFANTMGIVGTSFVNSFGTWAYTGGQTDVGISLGAGSYSLDSQEFGYIGKRGNSFMENLGYSFGMLANITDMMSFLSGGGQNITANSAKIKKDDWWGHHSLTDKNGNSLVSVGPDSGVITNATDGSKLSISEIYKNSIKGADLNWDSYADKSSTWKVPIHNVSKNILGNYSSSRWDLLLFSCTSHSAKALWMAGVPNLFGFHPHLLNAQLLTRNYGILLIPYIIQNEKF